jgi:hypothetical protein
MRGQRSEISSQRSARAVLTGAGASVSPKGREMERKQVGSPVFFSMKSVTYFRAVAATERRGYSSSFTDAA